MQMIGLGTMARKSGVRVLVINSGKGGIGKTTFSQNLAYNLVALGRRVCLVDTDKQAMTSNLLDTSVIPEHRRHTLTNVVRDGIPLIEAMFQTRQGLWIVPSDSNIEKAAKFIVVEEAPDVMVDRVEALREMLGPPPKTILPWQEKQTVRMRDFKLLELVSARKVLERPSYLDYLIFDFAPDPGALGRAILRTTDEIWSPLELEPLPMQGFAQMLLSLEDMFRTSPQRKPPIQGIIPFKVMHKRDLTTKLLVELKMLYPRQTTRCVHDDAEVPKSQDLYPAQALFEFNRSSRPSKELFELTLQVDGYSGRLEGSPSCEHCREITAFVQEQLAEKGRKG
jgi:cellulose biosynthesis protein BcsQ